jgi:hypothetical protein
VVPLLAEAVDLLVDVAVAVVEAVTGKVAVREVAENLNDFS